MSIQEEYLKRLNSENPIYRYILLDDDLNLHLETEKSEVLEITKSLNTSIIYFNKRNEEFENKYYKYILSINELSLEKRIINLLHKYNYKISCAESCTGGMIISRLIGVSGASLVIDESYITYSNESKIKILGVKKETIKKYGVASSEVAEEMAIGLRKITNSNICISITGFTADYVENETPVKNETDGDYYFAILLDNVKKQNRNYIHLEKAKVVGSRNECRIAQSTYILWNVLKLLEYLK